MTIIETNVSVIKLLINYSFDLKKTQNKWKNITNLFLVSSSYY